MRQLRYKYIRIKRRKQKKMKVETLVIKELETVRIKSSDDILKLTDDLKDKKQEHFITITLDGAHNVIQRRIVFIGTLNKSIVHLNGEEHNETILRKNRTDRR